MASVLNFPDMIATLATMSILRGAAYLLLDNAQKFVQTPLRVIGNSRLFGLIPTPTILMLAITAAGILVLRYTRFGRYVLAVGGNRNSAVFSGLNVTRIRIGAYAICGACAALGGIVYAGRIGSIAPNSCMGYEFTVIHGRRAGRHKDERWKIVGDRLCARLHLFVFDRKRDDYAQYFQLLSGLCTRADDAVRHCNRYRDHHARWRRHDAGAARALFGGA